jgi:hypothetical protein
MAGVLYVWSLTEFSIAVVSDRKSGIHRAGPTVGRFDATSSIRSSAAGLSNASHNPPSEAKPFWGAK